MCVCTQMDDWLRFASIDKTKDQIGSNDISHSRLILHPIEINLDLNSITCCHSNMARSMLDNLLRVGFHLPFSLLLLCLFAVGTICNTLCD